MGKFKGRHYNIADYEQFGVDICHAILEYSDPAKVKQTLEMLQTEADVEDENEESDNSDYSSEGESDDEALPESTLKELSGGVMSQFLELSRAGSDRRQPRRPSLDAAKRGRLKKKSLVKCAQERGNTAILRKDPISSKQPLEAPSSDDLLSSHPSSFSSIKVPRIAQTPAVSVDIHLTNKDKEDDCEEEEEEVEEEEEEEEEAASTLLRVSSAPGNLSRQTSALEEAEGDKQVSNVLVCVSVGVFAWCTNVRALVCACFCVCIPVCARASALVGDLRCISLLI